jgi:hypothetical protein
MARRPPKVKAEKEVSTLTHEGAARRNIPTAEYRGSPADLFKTAR